MGPAGWWGPSVSKQAIGCVLQSVGSCGSFVFLFIWPSGVLIVVWWGGSLLQHAGFFSRGVHTPSCGAWDLVPGPGIRPRSPALEGGVLATGIPG